MKEIIVINGPAGIGKDSFVKEFSKYRKTINFSSVDKVKEVAKIIGWTGAKLEKDRKFLSDLKALTTKYNDMSYVDTVEAIRKFKKSDNEYMFIHIREKEDIERIVKEFKATTLLIVKDNVEIIASNVSDANIFEYEKYDYTIKIDVLENLEKYVKDFIKVLEDNENKHTT